MKDELEDVVSSEVGQAGYDLVDLKRRGTKSRPVIEVRIDRRDAENVTVDDCAKVSRAIEARLDGGGIVAERYVLQVSSPGDRPIRTSAEWRRFVGRWANVVSPTQGGRFEGKIASIDGADGSEVIVLEMERGAQRRIPLADVTEARLAFHW